jgi:hypothetical protein
MDTNLLEIEFRHDSLEGRVLVSCVANLDPPSVGKGADALGFPVCTATIEYPGEGYRALFGWVQLVRSTDNASGGASFEMDPARFFEDSPAPYCWYGIRPILFDAPSREERRPIDWVAYSFLGVTPRDAGARKLVLPLLGFSWGFRIDASEQITLSAVEKLAAGHWNDLIPFLTATYPPWEFGVATPQ